MKRLEGDKSSVTQDWLLEQWNREAEASGTAWVQGDPRSPREVPQVQRGRQAVLGHTWQHCKAPPQGQ